MNNHVLLLWKSLHNMFSQCKRQQDQPREDSLSHHPPPHHRVGIAIMALLLGGIIGMILPTYSTVRTLQNQAWTLLKRTNATKTSTTCTRAVGFPHESPCLPQFFIGGAMKCGTNEAMKLIQQHPRVKFHTCSDPKDNIHCTPDQFQGVEYDRVTNNGTILHTQNIWESRPQDLVSGRQGILRFLHRLPPDDITEGAQPFITLDKSPTFLETHKHPTFPETLHKLMPGTKMVFTLCDPAERLVSEFYHYHRKESLRTLFYAGFRDRGLTPPTQVGQFIDIITLSSPQCVENQQACRFIQEMYFSKGLYYTALMDWLKWYDPSEVLVLDMHGAAKENVIRMMELADLPLHEYPWDQTGNGNAFHNTKIDGYTGRGAVWEEYPQEMGQLAALYAESNKELASLINDEFPLRWKSTNGGK